MAILVPHVYAVTMKIDIILVLILTFVVVPWLTWDTISFYSAIPIWLASFAAGLVYTWLRLRRKG